MFEIAPKETYEHTAKIIKDHFYELDDANILILFQEKPRKSGGVYTLGTIHLPGKLLSFMSELSDSTATEMLKRPGEKVDYIMVLDKLFMTEIGSTEEQEKLIRHELRHTSVNGQGDYRIKDHDIQDFVEEIKLNGGDFNWAQNAITKLADRLTQKKDEQTVQKTDR